MVVAQVVAAVTLPVPGNVVPKTFGRRSGKPSGDQSGCLLPVVDAALTATGAEWRESGAAGGSSVDTHVASSKFLKTVAPLLPH